MSDFLGERVMSASFESQAAEHATRWCYNLNNSRDTVINRVRGGVLGPTGAWWREELLAQLQADIAMWQKGPPWE